MTLVDGIESESILIGDRGLHYGDGLFETLAVRDGTPLCWNQHVSRLGTGCARLKIPCPPDDLLFEEATRVCNGLALGVLKILITRGSGSRGYRMPNAVTPSRILATYPWPEFSVSRGLNGVAVTVCQTRLGSNPSLAGIKHLNRLEQVLARSEWTEPGIAEGLMLDTEDRVIEGTMSNLFLVMHDCLLTPDLAKAGVAGIMRDLVMLEAARLGVAVSVAPVTLEDIGNAEELFLCNSLFGLWPISSLDGRAYRVGPLALRLRRRLLADGYIAGVESPGTSEDS